MTREEGREASIRSALATGAVLVVVIVALFAFR